MQAPSEPLPYASWIMMFVQHKMRRFQQVLLHCWVVSRVAFLKPPAKEHKVSRVRKRCLHKLSLQCYVFGEGASTVYKTRLQFYSSNNGCVHSPFKAGKMQHNVTGTSSVWPSGEEECQIMTPWWLQKHYSGFSLFLSLNSPSTKKKISWRWKVNVWCIDLRTCLCDIGQIHICFVERKQVPIVNNAGTEKSTDSKAMIDSAVAPLPLSVTSNAIYFLLAFVSTRASLSPHKDSSLRLKSSPRKFFLKKEINSATFTMQSQRNSQTRPDLQSRLNTFSPLCHD